MDGWMDGQRWKLKVPWFLAGNGIALQCIATATTAAAAASELPPSAVQDSEGRGGIHIAAAARG